MTAIALFIISFKVLSQELQRHSLQDIWQNLATIPPMFLGAAIALVCLNYWVMTGYDTLAGRYVKASLAYGKTALAAFISYGISKTVGASFLSGSLLRYRFYHGWGLTPVQIAQIIAFCNLSFWLGLLSMGGVILLSGAIELPASLGLPGHSMQSLGLFALITVAVYLMLSALNRRSLRIGSISIPQVPLPLALGQISLTCVDWAIAATTFFALLTPESLEMLPQMIGVYVVAQLAGVFSNLPAGIGVFETVMVYLLSPVFPSIDILGALVCFRLLHNLLPMAIASLTLLIYEARYLRRLPEQPSDSVNRSSTPTPQTSERSEESPLLETPESSPCDTPSQSSAT